MIISHDHEEYMKKWLVCGGKHNGAYYYSREIVRNIIPHVNTDRNWITINIPGVGCDHAIVFIHNNLHSEHYDWLKAYKDLILVCGIPETCEKVAHLGRAVYLPLSVDVEEVKAYKTRKKPRSVAYVGRRSKRRGIEFPPDVEYIEALPRPEFLARMAEYKKIYAVGRAAIEGLILDCEILPYDPRFPDPERWQVMDNLEAAALLQRTLNEIDGGRND